MVGLKRKMDRPTHANECDKGKGMDKITLRVWDGREITSRKVRFVWDFFIFFEN